jgi:hypothetical protein
MGREDEGPNGRQGLETSHLRDGNHKEWRDRSEAVATTNVMGLSGAAARDGDPWPYRRARIGSKTGLAASSGAAGRHIGDRVGVLGFDCGGWGRRDLHPSLAQLNGLTQPREELFFAVVPPPPPAAMEFEKIRTSALGQEAPFLRDLLKCMRRWPFRHGEAVSIAVRDV